MPDEPGRRRSDRGIGQRNYAYRGQGKKLRLSSTIPRTFRCCSGLRWARPPARLMAHSASRMRPSCRIPLCLARSKRNLFAKLHGAGSSGAIFVCVPQGFGGLVPKNLHPLRPPDNLTNWLINSLLGALHSFGGSFDTSICRRARYAHPRPARPHLKSDTSPRR